MRPSLRSLFALAGLAASAACGDAPTEPEPAAIPENVLIAALGTFPTFTGADSLVPCPAGGEIETKVELYEVTQGDPTVVTFRVAVTHRACATQLEDGVLLLDGRVVAEGTEKFRGGPNRPVEILERNVRQAGSIRLRHGALDRTCVIDLVQSFDGALRAFRINGTLCGKDVDFAFRMNS